MEKPRFTSFVDLFLEIQVSGVFSTNKIKFYAKKPILSRKESNCINGNQNDAWIKLRLGSFLLLFEIELKRFKTFSQRKNVFAFLAPYNIKIA